MLILFNQLVEPITLQNEKPKPRTRNRETKPNIVFILPDDMGYADVGFNGCQDIKTPNMDELAGRGTIFTSHYAQPVSSPTRASLKTGRYPPRTGVFSTINAQRPALFQLNERLLSEGLRDAAYVTAIYGKWHLGQSKPEYMPTRRGFDHPYSFMSGSLDPFTKIAAGPGNKRDGYRDDHTCADEGYDTDLIATEACRIIENKPADKPLFHYVPFHAVHTPWKSTPEDQKPHENLSSRRKDLAIVQPQRVQVMLARLNELTGNAATPDHFDDVKKTATP